MSQELFGPGKFSPVFVDMNRNKHKNMPFLQGDFLEGSLIGTHFRGIKQCKCMVVLRDFRKMVPCLGW